jgi:hypothetical protein
MMFGQAPALLKRIVQFKRRALLITACLTFQLYSFLSSLFSHVSISWFGVSQIAVTKDL